MPGHLTLDALRADVASGAIDTVVAAQVDMQGRLMGKRFHAGFFLDGGLEETHACNYLLATDMEMHTVEGYRATSWAAGYGDYAMVPDLATLRRVPWLEGTALVLCDVVDHRTHEPVAHSPRAVLRRQVARLAERGLAAMVATELEFFLFDRTFRGMRGAGYPADALSSAYNEDYHVFQTTKEEDVMRAVRNGLAGADVPVETTKGEASAGQEEVNIRYADALTMADRHSVVKNAIKEIAHAKGRSVTFMAKWRDGSAGSSSHVHQSLREGDRAAFHDPDAEHGMSAAMRAYLAGLLAHAEATTLFLAPHVNSYKRFAAGTFAPTKIVWSMDNRTAGYRVVGEGTPAVRVECRVGGADLNPYLALASQIAAGLDGVERGLELEPASAGDAYGGEATREIPRTLRDAVAATDASEALRAAMGGEVVDHYLHAARWEQEVSDTRVSDVERLRLFEGA